MTWPYYTSRTLADDLRDSRPERRPSGSSHVHFHAHGGRHAHRHTHVGWEPEHAHSSRTDLPAHEVPK